MLWLWSRWKRQYLSLDFLLGCPFNLSGHVKATSSLIYIRTWSIGAVSGVKFANLPTGGLERLSSRWSPILVIFRPLSCRVSSCLSLFLGFSSRASNVSFTFIYLVARYSTFDMVFKLFLYKENKNFPFPNPLVNAATSLLSSASSIERAFLLKSVM